MKRDWQECSFDSTTARRAGFHVTMAPDGEIYLSASTLGALGNSDRFLLMYDRLSNSIGLKPAHASTPRAMKTAKRGRGGGRVIRAYRLCKEFGISVENKIRFLKPEVEDGVLVLNLHYTEKNARGGN